jgi:hypothetical protein
MNQTVLNRSRNDKFVLVLDLPRVMKDSVDGVLQSSYSANQIQFTIFGSPVPKISVPEIDVPFGGQHIKVSSMSRPSFPSLDVKFLVDNGYQNYWTLWKWMNLFNDSRNSTSSLNTAVNTYKEPIRLTNPLDRYSSNFTLFALDEFDKRIISFEYTGVFITGLSEINYSYQDPAEITCNASFVYNQLNVNLLKNVNASTC